MPPHPAPRAGLSASATGVFLLLLVLADTSCVSSMHEYQGHTVFNPLYTPYLESSARDRWQLPEEVLEALGVAPGQTIADIGAGGGYFTERFSRKVGPAGRVFATDVQKTMVRKLERRVEKRDLANVTVIRGAFDDPRLPPASCDLVFFSSVYKEIDERPRYLQHVMKTLKPGGRVAILEYRPQTREPGPPREHRLSEETVLAEMGAAGFELVERHDFLPREYFLVFGLARREGSPGAEVRDHFRAFNLSSIFKQAAGR